MIQCHNNYRLTILYKNIKIDSFESFICLDLIDSRQYTVTSIRNVRACCVCVRACVRACVRVCVRVCVCFPCPVKIVKITCNLIKRASPCFNLFSMYNSMKMIRTSKHQCVKLMQVTICGNTDIATGPCEKLCEHQVTSVITSVHTLC